MSESGGYRRPGEPIVRREVWRGRVVGAWAGIVVADGPDLLAVWMGDGSPFSMTYDFFGAPHPWAGRDHWSGPGVLQLQRRGDPYAVWHGDGPDLSGWYVNLQEPFRRTHIGFDTIDQVLDIVVSLDGAWRLKDDDELDGWIARGRFTADEVAALRAEARRIVGELEVGRRWWSDEWLSWSPDPAWSIPELPDGWERAT